MPKLPSPEEKITRIYTRQMYPAAFQLDGKRYIGEILFDSEKLAKALYGDAFVAWPITKDAKK